MGFARRAGRADACRSRPSRSERGDRAARPITEIATEERTHRPSGIGEFDRVLGGGLVPGAAILLSGEPGVGKSTLLLEVAARSRRSAAHACSTSSAEESASQVRLRAERTGALHDELYLAAETDLATILGHIDAVQPAAAHRRLGADGVVGDVRRRGRAARAGARGRGDPHPRRERPQPARCCSSATSRKTARSPGPRLLEHLVDVVCSFEGDRQTALRFVRALKNRFGPTDEVGCFEMTGDGIAEVPDPSALFLSRRRPRSAAPASRSRSRAAARCPSRCRRSSSARRPRSRGGS